MEEYVESLDEINILLNDVSGDMKLIYPYEYCLITDAVNLVTLAKESFEKKLECLKEI